MNNLSKVPYDSRWGKRLRLFLSVAALASCSPSRPDNSSAAPSGQNLAQTYQPLVGQDGDYTVTTANTVVNGYTTIGLNANAGDKMITVTNAMGLNNPINGKPLQAGDLLLLYQAQGATIDTTDDPTKYGNVTALNGAGSFEFVTVAGLSGNVVSLGADCNGLHNGYPGNGATQVVRVPQFNSLTVQAGASIVAKAWDGQSGGVVAIHVLTQTMLAGSIDVTAQGFRGGQVHDLSNVAGGTAVTTMRTSDPTQGAEKGESIAGSTATYQSLDSGMYGRGAPANGGGGGNAHNAGGGGGGGGGDPTKWNGQGVMSNKVMGGMLAWALDPGYIANGNTFTTSTGGGRGGYSYSRPNTGVTPDPTLDAPGASKWGGDFRQDVGGFGGRPLNPVPGFQIFMGGGGGAADEDNNSGGNGGNGGGVVLLVSGEVDVPGPGTGFIKASGGDGADTTNGQNDAAGGGGGGGSIFIFSNKPLSNNVQLIADGGFGGSQKRPPSDTSEADGPGGGGGGGFIAHTTTGTPTTSVQGQVGGTTVATTMANFPSNGATNGNLGSVISAARQPTVSGMPSYYPLCLAADLQVTIMTGSGQVQPGSNATFTVAITNKGENPANGSDITTTLPSGVTASAITWTCTATGGANCAMNNGTGALPAQADLPAGGTLTFTMTVPVPSSSTSPSLTLTVMAQPPPGYEDPVPANNSATAMVPIAGVVVTQPNADLQVTVNANPTMPQPGTSTTVTIIAKNNGPDAAPQPVVVFSIPAGSTVTMPPPMPGDPNSPWGCVAMGLSYSCTLNQNLTAGTTAMPIVVVFTTPGPSSTGPGTPQVPVVIGSPGAIDPNPVNNSVTVNVGPSSPAGTADLALTMQKSPTSAGPGQETTFTLQVNNLGPDTAENPTVMINVPGGSQVTQPAMGTGWSCALSTATFICLTSSLAPGAAAPITLKLIAPLPKNGADPGSVTGDVGSSSTIDPNPANNSAGQPIAANPTPTGSDLLVRITVDKPNPVPGDTVTYTAVASNNGPDSVTEPFVVINLPPGVTVVQSAQGDGWTCSQLALTALCTRPALAEGDAPPINVKIMYPSTGTTGLPPGTVVTNAPGNNDPNPSNNTGVIDPRPPLPATAADLALTITKSPSSAGAGTPITYTLQAENKGPGAVQNPGVTFSVPSTSTIIQPASGSGWTCVQRGFSFSCYLNSSLPANASASPITVQVNTPVPSDSSQDPGAVSGEVSSPSNVDPQPLNNVASVPVGNAPPTGSDLSITLSANPQQPQAGDTVTYQAIASNAGPATVLNPVVTINLPPGGQIVSGPSGDGWNCEVDSNVVLCTRPSVSMGSAPPINVKVFIPAYGQQGLPPSIAAVKAPNNNDPNLNNNVSSSQESRFTGGGFACSLAAQPVNAGSGFAWFFGTALALLALRTRRRSSALRG